MKIKMKIEQVTAGSVWSICRRVVKLYSPEFLPVEKSSSKNLGIPEILIQKGWRSSKPCSL